MKSIAETLRSPRFMRDLSQLLFIFAALGGVIGIIVVARSQSDPAAFTDGATLIVQSLLYVALAIMIRRGSVKALWATVILFTLDTALILLTPLSEGAGKLLLARGLLLAVIIRHISKLRKTSSV